MAMEPKDFFTEYGEANRYTIKEVIGKGSYGVVCSATDNFTGETVGSIFQLLLASNAQGAQGF